MLGEQSKIMIALITFMLATVTGSVFTIFDIVSARFGTTMTLVLRRSKAIYLLGFIHGIIAGLVSLLHPHVIDIHFANGTSFRSPWIWAIVTGAFTRSLFQSSFFTVSTGRSSTAIGLKSIVQLFEPSLMREVILDEFFAVRSFVQKYAASHPDLDALRALITENLPPDLPEPERQAFLSELALAKTVIEAMEKFLRFVGVSAFRATLSMQPVPGPVRSK
jgi:hypothetical protein